jgi:hypothetical protein
MNKSRVDLFVYPFICPDIFEIQVTDSSPTTCTPYWDILMRILMSSLIFAPEMNTFIHRVSSAYLALIILFRMMAMPISFLDYSINREFIAKNLCENRLKPAMHCAGKCFLDKQLTKANNNQESQDQKGTFRNLIIDFYEPLNKPCFGYAVSSPEYFHQYKTCRVSSPFNDSIFHPPIA